MMGYRPMPFEGEPELHASAWGKPVGYSLMALCDSEQHGIEWMQWFWHAEQQKPILWSRKVYGDDKDWSPYPKNDGEANMLVVYGPSPPAFIAWVKKCENWDQKAGFAADPRGSSFEFLTLTQTLGGVP